MFVCMQYKAGVVAHPHLTLRQEPLHKSYMAINPYAAGG